MARSAARRGRVELVGRVERHDDVAGARGMQRVGAVDVAQILLAEDPLPPPAGC